MSILIFIIVLAILILAHEFGHFSFAKFFNMRVDEFGIGFPPRLFGKKRGETLYSVNAIPFGGFVKIFGENPDETTDGGDKRSFVNQHWGRQMAVLVAGVFFNLVLAYLLLSFGFMYGLPASAGDATYGEVLNPKLLIVSVSDNSPAGQAGLRSGDEIIFAESNGRALQGEDLDSLKVQDLILLSDGNEVNFLYKRDGENKTAFIIPSYDIVPDKPAVGIVMDNIGTLKLPIWKSFVIAFQMTGSIFYETVKGFGNLIIGAFQGEGGLSQITGPVGIVGLVGDASNLGFTYLLSFTAFISINLAVINLIPFPALDGGRILFVIIETIRGKKIKPIVANTLNIIGFVLLIVLMIAVTYNDIVKIYN